VEKHLHASSKLELQVSTRRHADRRDDATQKSGRKQHDLDLCSSKNFVPKQRCMPTVLIAGPTICHWSWNHGVMARVSWPIV